MTRSKPESDTSPARTTKSALLRQMLSRRGGAALTELCEALGWQPHSVRAALSGLRKAGHTIERRLPKSADGAARYRLTGDTGQG